ncbi:methylmalonic aciduria type A protein, mitochondrial-like [Oppia nitens]|uniref:methylmalonic aciduria type A protein, mitochondrial-like n=1 Tax=Oppia nitens TaxID=1686743 RepID=UPI0023DC3ED7|nr:methylmalonic aciduria type A protein, mitochondrial-like [Oppia nitens]
MTSHTVLSNTPVNELFTGLIRGHRASLSRAITVVESKRSPIRRQLLQLVNEHNVRIKRPTLRLGISGAPGAGKSTFIETFGMNLIEKYNKSVAVLAVDPSSAINGGSILADKTRMFHLSRHPKAFIRPSPSSGHMGGVTRTTSNAISLCESAGYDVIIIETVGVGQSEYEVSYLCDLMTLLVAPSGGDELQAIKKGIIEMANIIVVTKSDGDLVKHARKMSAEIKSATKFISYVKRPQVLRCSAVTGEGIDDVWTQIQQSVESEDKKLEKRREQRVKQLKIGLINEFFIELNRRIQLDKYENLLKIDETVVVEDIIAKIFDEDLRYGFKDVNSMIDN